MNEADAENVLGILVGQMIEDERKGLPSAHSWRRNELCAGSHQLSLEARKLGQEAYAEPSEASAKGDRIHAALAGEKVELSESEAETVRFLEERTAEQVLRLFGEKPVEHYFEERYWLKLDSEPVASGRVDYLVISGDTALIIDFKTGFSEVDPARTNSQLKLLAVLVGVNFPQLHTIYTQLISGPYGISENCYDLAGLRDAWYSVIGTLKAINNPRAGFNPSVEACRFCPANLICQATKDLIKPVAKLQHSPLPVGERAAKLLDECELIARHLEEIQAYYRRMIEQDPKAVPGWGLEPGAPRRQVKDWSAARQKLEEFIDATKLDQLAAYSVPAVEKLLGEAIGVKAGPKLKEQFANILGELLEQKYPTPSLQRVSGKPKLVEAELR